MRLLLLAGIVLVLAGSAAALMDGESSGEKRHEAPGFSFSYPGSWHRVRGVDLPLGESAGDLDVGRHTVGLDLDNWTTVYTTTLELRVTEENVADLLPATRELYEALVKANPGTKVLAGPYTVTEAGLPGVRTRMAGTNTRGQRVEVLATQLFRGRHSYVITCSSEAGRAEAIAAGCKQVMATLRPR